MNRRRPTLLLSFATALAAASMLQGGNAVAAPTSPSSLAVGDRLTSGAALQSSGGRYRVTMQTDGNLVERRIYDAVPVWTSHSAGHPGATLVVQSDGNVVVHSSAGRAVWNAGSFGAGVVFSIQDDGNMVVRASGRAVWSKGVDTTGERTDTLTAGHSWSDGHSYRSLSGEYVVEPLSGALLLFHGHGGAIWTGGRDQADVAISTVAMLQTDGNLVVRARGVVVWQTGTAGSGSGNRLQIQDDGNLVMRTAAGRVVWASGTVGR